MVRDFYEKFIEEESVEEGRTLMKKEGEEKILLWLINITDGYI